jgi:hypothetical protein
MHAADTKQHERRNKLPELLVTDRKRIDLNSSFNCHRERSQISTLERFPVPSAITSDNLSLECNGEIFKIATVTTMRDFHGNHNS